VDAWDNKPPGTYYAHAAVLGLVPSAERWSRSCLPGVQQECGYLALQLADVVWTSLTGLAVFGVARALGFTRGAAVLACGVFLVFANLSQLSREGSTPEKQLLLPMALSYLAAVRGGPRGLFLAGLGAGVAFLFKQTALSIPLALLAWWTWRRVHGSAAAPALGGPAARAGLVRLITRGVVRRGASAGRGGGIRAVAGAAWFGLGWAVPVVLTVAYFASRGALGALWEASFGYNVTQAGSSVLAIPRGGLSGAWHVFANSSALLWLLGLGGALLARGPARLLVCWAVADALSLGLGGAKFAQVYFVQLVPSLALLSALAMAQGARLTRGLPLVRAYAGVVALAIFLLSNQFQASVVLRAFWERTPPHASVPLERQLASQLTGGTLLVWGDNSEIYLYAHARSPSRFFHTFPLSHQYTGGTGYLQRRAELLRAEAPEVVAIDPATARDDPDGSLGLNLSSFPELQSLLAQQYVPLDNVPGGWQAYRRR
jgi:hypothetical protein